MLNEFSIDQANKLHEFGKDSNDFVEVDAELIKKRRLEKGLTILALSKLTGISQPYISQIENRVKTNISGAMKKKLYEALDLNILNLDAEIARYLAKVEQFAHDKEREAELIKEGEKWLGYIQSPYSTEIGLTLARLYRRNKNLHKSLEHAEAVRDIFTKQNDQYGVCRANYEIALLDMDTGHYELAAIRLQRIEMELHKLGVMTSCGFFETQVYFSLAACGACLDDALMLNRYLPFTQAYLNLVPEGQAKWYNATSKYLTAETLLKNGNFISATKMFEDAANIYTQKNDFASAIRMKHNIAETLVKAGEFDKAESICNVVLQLKRDNFMGYNSTSATQLLMAEIALAKGNISRAQQLSRPIFEGKPVTDITLKASALKIFADSLLAKNDVEGYTRYIEEAIIVLGNKNSDNAKQTALKNKLVSEYLSKNPLKGLLA